MRLASSAFVPGCLVAGLALACSDSDDGVGPLQSYELTVQQPALVLVQDSSAAIGGAVTVGQRTLEAPPIFYRSEHPAIALVTATGTVEAVKPGATTVYAIYREDTVAVAVTVVGNPVATIVKSPTSIALGSGVGTTLASGQTVNLAVTLLDADGDTLYCTPRSTTVNAPCGDRFTRPGAPNDTLTRIHRRVTVASSHPSVASATVLSTGAIRITAADTGTAWVLLGIPGDDRVDSTLVTVTRRPITSVLVRPLAGATPAVSHTGTLGLEAVLNVSSPTAVETAHRSVTWSSSRPTVATVNATTGVVSGRPLPAGVVSDTVTIFATTVPVPGDQTPRQGKLQIHVVRP